MFEYLIEEEIFFQNQPGEINIGFKKKFEEVDLHHCDTSC